MHPADRVGRVMRAAATLVLALALQPQLPAVAHIAVHALSDSGHGHAHDGVHPDARHGPHGDGEHRHDHHDVPDAPAAPSIVPGTIRLVAPVSDGDEGNRVVAALVSPDVAPRPAAFIVVSDVLPSYGSPPDGAAAPRAPPATPLHA